MKEKENCKKKMSSFWEGEGGGGGKDLFLLHTDHPINGLGLGQCCLHAAFFDSDFGAGGTLCPQLDVESPCLQDDW